MKKNCFPLKDSTLVSFEYLKISEEFMNLSAKERQEHLFDFLVESGYRCYWGGYDLYFEDDYGSFYKQSIQLNDHLVVTKYKNYKSLVGVFSEEEFLSEFSI